MKSTLSEPLKPPMNSRPGQSPIPNLQSTFSNPRRENTDPSGPGRTANGFRSADFSPLPSLRTNMAEKRTKVRCLFSGVRPSPGAPTQGKESAIERYNTLDTAEQPVAEDGHSPLNRYKVRAPHALTLPTLLTLLTLGPLLHAADPFAEFIRSTGPRTPQEELKGFRMPPGFQVQLVASEPDIGKPMNMAFDEKGRLWITQSREYPFPVPLDKKGRDKVMVLDQFDAGGRAQKITTFAEGLNIPIGLLPYKDGALVFSIPYIHYFQDTDGDGRTDQEKVTLGRLGFEKDTHGLTSSFRRGFDGWIYADHGYNNDTTLTGSDGSSIKMNSGNCYRFKPDGSRVEQFTWGQVNPFGLMFDPLGDLWSADCHSSPVYVLLRGAYYPSFGKPHDGLGFAPDICAHSHGSTAIAGIVYYAAENFPAEYRGNTFIGNVMTCRINRDSFAEHGSTRIAREEPDFLSSDDPWFRPVDLQLGPDGALYVADFYNRIIGHYEVRLDHPGRDRERGRIWRIVYRGDTGGRSGEAQPRLALSDGVDGLIAELGNPNITRRMLAMNTLVDKIGQPVIEPLRKTLQTAANPFQKAHGLWVLHRLGSLDEKTLASAAVDDDRLVRVHVMRVLSEIDSWSAGQRSLAQAGLKDSDGFAQRAAADALGRHPDLENVRPLLALRQHAPSEDAELVYKVRQALRDQLHAAEVFARLPLPGWSEADARAIADVAVGVQSTAAGSFLLGHLQKVSEDRETMVRYLQHAVRFMPETDLDTLANFTRTKFAGDVDLQMALFKSVQDGTAQRGSKLSEGVRAWGAELAESLLVSTEENAHAWHNTPVEGMKETKNPWFVQQRASADSDKAAPFLCSLPPDGEQLTGILRSEIFTVPARLRFFLAGHDGYPDKPAQKRNVVRLRAADTQEVLAERFPPRNDLAQPVTWDLPGQAGKKAWLEVVDGDTGNAYAWLAIGRFEPPVLAVPAVDPSQLAKRQETAADLAASLMLAKLEPRLARLLLSPAVELDTRAAMARALLSFHPDDHLSALASMIGDAGVSSFLREKICQALAAHDPSLARTNLIEAMRTSPRRLQVKLAQAMASTTAGGEQLLQMAAAGQAPPGLLQERAVQDKLRASKPVNAAARIEQLTKGLAPLNKGLQRLIDVRRKNYEPTRTSLLKGEQTFTQSCRPCHQLDGIGTVIGPQLDGAGNRGLERLCEDVLDPNRSVDPAFRSTLLILKDGDVVSGLLRREETEMVVLADSTGKEVSVPKKQIEERRQSETSLMPENFGEIIPPEDFNNLMAFLLSKGSKPTPP